MIPSMVVLLLLLVQQTSCQLEVSSPEVESDDHEDLRSESVRLQRILEECDSEGRVFCSTDFVPNEDLINEAIQKDEKLKVWYDQSDNFGSTAIQASNELHRRRLRNTRSGNYADVCTSIVEITEPFSFVKGAEGWQQIASTPQFPQRVTFQTEKCSRSHVPCRGIISTSSERLLPLCVQEYARHTILTFNQTTKNIEPRYISLPNACKCKLEVRSFITSASGWRDKSASGSKSASTETADVNNNENQPPTTTKNSDSVPSPSPSETQSPTGQEEQSEAPEKRRRL